MFDKDNNNFVFRNEFTGSILEGQLKLSQDLTPNMANLLLFKYDPNQTFRIYYEEFINDLKRVESEHPRELKIFLSVYE